MKYAPLTGFFMLTSLLGFIISVMVIWGLSKTWSLAFAILFGAMFIASILSMTYAKPESLLKVELHKHKKR